ncbi:hypothetical protein [Dyella mobilis]|uniref:Glutaredoxin n=1 Tax=Dyella mobilis TaxID=1849582 RepID=A0ABS2KK96_9GAMM|nr:hypothetical protein [Dyella mobilis]MBM7131217.1 hypothetical protein [Dyella mobilis]GLQ98847.1 hypothetical protein GCM10007863_32670 [Dyella mobilis]
MRAAWLLLLLCIAGGVYHYKYADHPNSVTSVGNVDDGSAADEHGFVQLPEVIGFDTSRVMVVAAENCPHADAQRADHLAEALRDRGIPVSRTHEVRFNPAHIDMAVAQRIPSVMEGALPIVFIHGRAKGNPSLDEVVAEYQDASADASADSSDP